MLNTNLYNTSFFPHLSELDGLGSWQFWFMSHGKWFPIFGVVAYRSQFFKEPHQIIFPLSKMEVSVEVKQLMVYRAWCTNQIAQLNCAKRKSFVVGLRNKINSAQKNQIPQPYLQQTQVFPWEGQIGEDGFCKKKWSKSVVSLLEGSIHMPEHCKLLLANGRYWVFRNGGIF